MTAGNKRRIAAVVALITLLGFDVGFQLVAQQIYRVLSSLKAGNLLSAIAGQSVMFVFAILMTAIFVKKGFLTSVLFRSDRKSPWRYVLVFALVWPILLSAVYGLVYLLDVQTWLGITRLPLPTASDMRSTLFFQSLFPGLGEEPLYRGFLIVLLVGRYWDADMEISTLSRNLIIVLSAVIFSVAHLSYTFSPFSVLYDSYQLLTALVLGGFQAYVFIKTRNLWGSIWIHNIANVTMSLVVWAISSMF